MIGSCIHALNKIEYYKYTNENAQRKKNIKY